MLQQWLGVGMEPGVVVVVQLLMAVLLLLLVVVLQLMMMRAEGWWGELLWECFGWVVPEQIQLQ